MGGTFQGKPPNKQEFCGWRSTNSGPQWPHWKSTFPVCHLLIVCISYLRFLPSLISERLGQGHCYLNRGIFMLCLNLLAWRNGGGRLDDFDDDNLFNQVIQWLAGMMADFPDSRPRISSRENGASWLSPRMHPTPRLSKIPDMTYPASQCLGLDIRYRLTVFRTSSECSGVHGVFWSILLPFCLFVWLPITTCELLTT